MLSGERCVLVVNQIVTMKRCRRTYLLERYFMQASKVRRPQSYGLVEATRCKKRLRSEVFDCRDRTFVRPDGIIRHTSAPHHQVP